ncbi:MAG: hypothetical protein LYZ69_07825 [Nitrososphaerales archaeon]|nr:hypothetical protein [Nitrososphaerales archaeon]
MNARFRSLVWPALGVLLVVAPPYAFEKLAQHFFLIHSQTFATFSGDRYYFDVVYLALAAGALGYRFGPTRAWVTYLLSVFILVSLFYAVCQPLLCYSLGADGLEPLRMGSFFAAEGVATAYLGSFGRSGELKSRWQTSFVEACTFYAIAYNAVVFTLAGAKVLAPFDPFATLVFLGILSLTVTLKAPQGMSVVNRLALPAVSQGALLLLGAGMAWQYFWEILPFAFSSLLVTFVGAVLALAMLRGGTRAAALIRESPWPLVGIVLFVLLTSLVVWPDAVAGQVVASSNPGMPSSYSYAVPLYVGGFMSSPMVRPTAVSLNVSFADSDVAAIPAGNFIAAGIGVHSADCCTDGIDYGYRFDVVLWGNGSENLAASAWRICDANAACGGHSWKILLYRVSAPYRGESPDQPLRLTLRWENHTVVWEYGSDAEPVVLGSFQASARMNVAFNAGWLGPPDKPSPGGAFFFQFGVTSLRPLNGAWAVTFACPSILLNGTWSCVDHAQSLQGNQSYWKVLWRWGETFPNVGAAADAATKTVSFHDSTSTIGSFADFW